MMYDFKIMMRCSEEVLDCYGCKSVLIDQTYVKFIAATTILFS